MHHPQVVQSPIFNDCLKVKIDGPTELKLVSKILLQVSVIELHKNLVSDTYNGGLKEARDAEKISLSVIQHYVHYCYPNLKKCLQDTR